MTDEQKTGPASVIGYIVAGLVALAGTVIVLILIIAMFGVYGRWNSRQNAQNKVKVSATEIKNQGQRIKVAKQQAQIRYENAVGIRESQDEIAKTLTPLYVQFEMTQVLMKIAQSGKNNSVVYLPSGANGIPLVATTDPTKVGQPDDSK